MALLVLFTFTCSPAWPAEIQPEREDGSFRVISYNIHLGDFLRKERKAPDKYKHLFSIAARLVSDGRVENPDILGLQEICANEDEHWQMDYFHRAVAGGRGYYFSGLADPHSRLGCGRSEAVFSRWPIRDGGVIQLPDVKEPRSAIWVDIEVPRGDSGSRWLRVYNAHLENRPKGDNWEGRYRQARAISAHLEAFVRDYPERPVILLGDLNTVGMIPAPWVREPTLFEFRRHLEPALWDKFHQTLIPWPLQLDWIFQRNLELVGARVARLALSDHFPVVADYRWKD